MDVYSGPLAMLLLYSRVRVVIYSGALVMLLLYSSSFVWSFINAGPLAMLLLYKRVLCGCLFWSFGNAPVVQTSSVWIGSASVIQIIEFCVDVYSGPFAVLQLYSS